MDFETYSEKYKVSKAERCEEIECARKHEEKNIGRERKSDRYGEKVCV